MTVKVLRLDPICSDVRVYSTSVCTVVLVCSRPVDLKVRQFAVASWLLHGCGSIRLGNRSTSYYSCARLSSVACAIHCLVPFADRNSRLSFSVYCHRGIIFLHGKNWIFILLCTVALAIAGYRLPYMLLNRLESCHMLFNGDVDCPRAVSISLPHHNLPLWPMVF